MSGPGPHEVLCWSGEGPYPVTLCTITLQFVVISVGEALGAAGPNDSGPAPAEGAKGFTTCVRCTRSTSYYMLALWQPTSRFRAEKPGATSARCLMTSNTTACVSRYVATTIPPPTWSRPTGTSVLNGRSRPAANLTHRPGK